MSRNHEKLNAKRWARARRAAFDRDFWRCRRCGAAGRLEAHHEPPLGPGVDAYAVDGILTYCRACHIEHHQEAADDTPGRDEWHAFVKILTKS